MVVTGVKLYKGVAQLATDTLLENIKAITLALSDKQNRSIRAPNNL